MAISFKRYVDITSGVAGSGGVRKRDLIGRIFSTNDLIPTKSFIEFDNADDVATYFGSASEEYARAAFYFGWIGKNITKAKKIAFARYVDADAKPMIFGAVKTHSLGAFTAITNGDFTLSIDGTSHHITAINLSAAVSLAGVATIIETAVNAETGAQFTGAVVSYNATRGSFDLLGGVTDDAEITVSAGTTTDVAGLLGWLSGAVLSNGAIEETLTDCMVDSTDASNNFGSFLFQKTLTLSEHQELATWNDTQNVMYQYLLPVSAANASAWYTGLKAYSGVGMTLSVTDGEYPEMIPMVILAATDYYKHNSTQNYMFQVFGLTPSVTKTTDVNIYDPLRTNYYGRTQTAGAFLDFYQRGVLMGLQTDPVDMNVYANEQWLKDAAAAAIMDLLLALAKVSANKTGRSQLLSTVQSVINEALFNGTISVGKTLSNTQKQYIISQTGDQNAWIQVQNLGYWFDCVLQSYVTQDNRTEWKAVYTLIYGKDDVIRKVEGSHQLI